MNIINRIGILALSAALSGCGIGSGLASGLSDLRPSAPSSPQSACIPGQLVATPPRLTLSLEAPNGDFVVSGQCSDPLSVVVINGSGTVVTAHADALNPAQFDVTAVSDGAAHVIVTDTITGNGVQDDSLVVN